MSATIRLQPLDGVWETLGVDRWAGVTPEGIEASSNEWGPDQMGFALKKQPGVERPDLLPFTPIELEVDGVLCWAGRTKAVPSSDRDLSVQCEGWQYHLDDDRYERMYVRQGLAGWQDIRDDSAADISTSYQSSYEVNVNGGGILIALPAASTVTASDSYAVALVDSGPDSLITRFVLTYIGGGHASFRLAYEMGTGFSSGGDGQQVIDAAPIATGSTTVAVTPATPRRFLRVALSNVTGSGVTGTNTSWVRLSSVIVFRSAAYESGNASILKADVVVKDALTFAPLLNQSVASVTTGTFTLPEYGTAGLETPRTIIESVSSYEGWQPKLGGSDLKTLVFGPRATAPLFEVGAASGALFADDSVTGEDIFNEVIIEATDNASQPVRVSRTQTGDLVTRRGFTRSQVMDVRSSIVTAAANQLGDLWLAEHRTAPLAGRISGSGAFIRSVQGGGSVPPHVLLLHSGELIRLAHRRDPDTGAQGRDGRIVGVTYRHDDRSLGIDVDDRRSSFGQALARYDINHQ